jgi:hypothetical protein
MAQKKKVVIEIIGEDECISLYDEAGQCVEDCFDTDEDAEKWAEENGYEVVETFNL